MRLTRMIMIFGAVLALDAVGAGDAAGKGGNGAGTTEVRPAVKIASAVKADGFLRLVLQRFALHHADWPVRMTVGRDREAVLKMLDAGEIDLAVVQLEKPDARTVFQALRPFIVGVNPSNQLESISLRRLRAIYAGTIMSWRDVGGPQLPIRLMVFPDASPEGTLLRDLLGVKTLAGAGRMTESGGRGVVALIGYDSASLGCFPAEYLTAGVKIVKIDGIAPDQGNVLSGKYPLTARVMVLQSPRASAAARQLVAYLRGPQAQEIYRFMSVIPLP